jgi:hypothetical protein
MSEVTITPSQIPEILDVATKLGISTLFTSEPGIGKTEIVTKYGNDNYGSTKDVRSSQLDPVDLSGVPTVRDGFTYFATPALLPNVDRDGEQGLFILDEFGDGSQATIVATQQLILEKRVGSYVFPEGWHIVAMMNKKEHGGVNRGLPYPLQNRFMHCMVVLDVPELLSHFTSKGVDPMVTSFLKQHGNLAHKRPDKGGSWAYPTPRTWEKLAQVRGTNPDNSIKRQLYSALVGEGAAAEFLSHEEVADQVPDPEQVIKEPKKAMVPENPSAQYAIAYSLAYWMKPDNMKNIMAYLDRLPAEYAVTSVTEARKITPEIEDAPEFVEWAVDNLDVLGLDS